MRNGTERKRLAAIAAALAVAGVMLLLVLAAAAEMAGTAAGLLDLVALGLCLLLGLAVAVGVLAALCQRLREIRGGEEEDARKY